MDTLRQLAEDLNSILRENDNLKITINHLSKRPTIAKFNALQEEVDGLRMYVKECRVRLQENKK